MRCLSFPNGLGRCKVNFSCVLCSSLPSCSKNCLCEEQRQPLGKAYVAQDCLECIWWLSPEEQCGRNNKVLLNICFSLMDEKLALACICIPAQPVCDREGGKRGKLNPLEVAGWLLKEGNVISLQIVRGSGVVGEQQLLHPEGRCSHKDQAHPHPWQAHPCLLFTPLHMGAEIKLSC